MKNLMIIATAAACLIGTAASAQVTSYTSKATFTTAATTGGRNVQTETFNTAARGNFASTAGVFNTAFDGFSVTGQNNGNYVGIANGAVSSGGPDYAIPSSFVGQNYLTWANITGGLVSLTINFNQATTAFGFDWFNTDYSDSYNIAVAGGSNYSSPPFTLASGAATSGFFGLVSSNPFTSIVITNRVNGGYISDEGMDNFVTNGVGSANPGAVPEPATWAMMLFGFAMIGYGMRSSMRRSNAKFDAKVKRIAVGLEA